MRIKKILLGLCVLVIIISSVGCQSEEEKQAQMKKEEEARKIAYAKIFDDYDKKINDAEFNSDGTYLKNYADIRSEYVKQAEDFLKKNKFNDTKISDSIEEHIKSMKNRIDIEENLYLYRENYTDEELFEKYVVENYQARKNSIKIVYDLIEKHNIKMKEAELYRTEYDNLFNKKNIKQGEEYISKGGGDTSIKVNKVYKDPHFSDTFDSADTNGKTIYRAEVEYGNVNSDELFDPTDSIGHVPDYILKVVDESGYTYKIIDVDSYGEGNNIAKGEKKKFLFVLVAQDTNAKEMIFKPFPYYYNVEIKVPVQ